MRDLKEKTVSIFRANRLHNHWSVASKEFNQPVCPRYKVNSTAKTLDLFYVNNALSPSPNGL